MRSTHNLKKSSSWFWRLLSKSADLSKPWGRFFQILCVSQKVRTLSVKSTVKISSFFVSFFRKHELHKSNKMLLQDGCHFIDWNVGNRTKIKWNRAGFKRFPDCNICTRRSHETANYYIREHLYPFDFLVSTETTYNQTISLYKKYFWNVMKLFQVFCWHVMFQGFACK